MKCKKVQRLLNRYIDNELPVDLHEHLEGCKECTYRLKELTRIKELIGAAAPYPTNPFLLTRIASAIEGVMPFPIWILRVWVPIATAFIFITSIIIYRLPEIERPVPKETEIFNIPVTPENMERITLNLLVYTNGHPLEMNF